MSVELARGEWAVLALLVEKPAHGWLLSQELAPAHEIGRIWSVERQQVYRALQRLSSAELIEATATERGDGAWRTVYNPTAAGRERVAQWLSEPVQHIREIPTTFALKVVLARRRGLDTDELVSAQRRIVVAAVDLLGLMAREASPDDRLPLTLRLETARAFLSFLDGLGHPRAAQGQRPSAARSRRSGSRPRRGDTPVTSRTHTSAVNRVSDFSGLPLEDETQAATIILRFRDARGTIMVAAAHVDDPVVAEIASVAREASPRRATGDR